MKSEELDSRIQLKQPVLAAILGYFIPGAGQMYQARYFKGVLFFVCIVGMFTYGLQMAEGKALYFKRGSARKEERKPEGRFRNWGFIAQSGIGLPCVAAYIQWQRYNADSNVKLKDLDEPLVEPFTGSLLHEKNGVGPQVQSLLTGTVSLKPVPGEIGVVSGEFTGTSDGKKIEIPLRGRIRLERAVMGSDRRILTCDVDHAGTELENSLDEKTFISGTVPRLFLDRFAAPLDEEVFQDLPRRLGNRYDLAVVLTWIAGLLNILAVWDAFEGPAYGYDDSSLKSELKQNKDSSSDEGQPPSQPGSDVSSELKNK